MGGERRGDLDHRRLDRAEYPLPTAIAIRLSPVRLPGTPLSREDRRSMRRSSVAPFEGVLIDLYGTLVTAGSRAFRAPHLHEMARVLGVDALEFESDWAHSLGARVLGELGTLEETIVEIAARHGVRPPSHDVRRAAEIRLAFSRATLESCRPVLPGLDALRRADLRLAVVSDCSEETARLWTSTPLGERIQITVFSCIEGVCKPDPRMYRAALQRLDLPAGRCAFVGDGGSRELTGATALGLTAHLYRFPGDDGQPDARYDPDTEWKGPPLKDLRDLLSAPG
jgi:putative hydrolase of the HAD superfamily